MNNSIAKIENDPTSFPKDNNTYDKKLLLWEIIGITFSIIIGSLFHFTFEWLGYWRPIGGFFPVNESVWEHLKLPFWTLMIFTLIEYVFVKEKSNNFIIGKAIAVLISIATILVVYYSYTTLLGVDLLIVDILSFIGGVIIGQLVSYYIITRKAINVRFTYASWIIIITLGLLFFLFTYIPPHLPIFQDSASGLYGILPHI